MEYIGLFLILIGALVLLITNRMPPDGVGLCVIVALIVTGQATTAEAFAGFSHPATLTVASILILSAGVQRTGVVDNIAVWFRRHARTSERRLLRIQTAVVAPVSAFISNTATVAVFLPVVLSVTRERGYSPSRFLIPLSFASLLGGMCTLIGTSTNVVVSTLALDHGLEPMRMFDFVPVGVAVAVVGFIYLIVLAPRLTFPRREGDNLAAAYHLRRYLTEVEILRGSDLGGKTLEQSRLAELHDMDVLEIHRGGLVIPATATADLEEGDVLLVRASLTTIRSIQESQGIRLRSEAKVELGDLVAGGMLLAEAVVPPGSPLENRSLERASFRNQYGVTAIALYHHREYIQDRVGRVPLHTGDVLLLYGSKHQLRRLAGRPEVLSVVKVLPPRPRRRLGRLSLLILGATVAGAATGLVNLVTVAVAGAALMVLTGCLTLRETYRSIDRRTILLLAGMISLGMAMERSGAAAFLAHFAIEAVSGMGPWPLLAVTYIATAILTETLTNNACAVIMTPIAIAAAREFGFDPRPFVFAVAYAASASFLTPWGYQTNMFVYGPGGYRFSDFGRIGFPLSLLTFATVVFLIPLIWPFHRG